MAESYVHCIVSAAASNSYMYHYMAERYFSAF